MKHPSITITGSILAADVLTAIEENDTYPGQSNKAFGLKANDQVKDHIARTYAESRQLWKFFQLRMQHLDESAEELGTTETRKSWMIPFLSLLGYDPQFSAAETVDGKSYRISHRDPAIDNFPIHIIGYKDSLDRKVPGRLSMAPHAMLQEYLNLTEHLYGLVTNGLRLRLLRDSSRLIKLSYLEFDLEQLFEEDHFADFALLYRLLHVSRMPHSQDEVADCLMEDYHQRALASGSRIRDGLSAAVKSSILSLANGFLQHPNNFALRQAVTSGAVSAETYYNWQLRLIYRMLFLMVIEERGLVFASNDPAEKKELYFSWYSMKRLRELSVHRFLADARYSDHWISLQQTFRLFESAKAGAPLSIRPLAGGLFSREAIGMLNDSTLSNEVVLTVLRALNLFTHPDTGQTMRVNYGALNVEEFGSVYEGLLEFSPAFDLESDRQHPCFNLSAGDERARSGSHYTPDELVAPLLEHSLDHLIADRLHRAGWNPNAPTPETRQKASEALLKLKICDVACGSGHILLNAARRISQALAVVRTGEDQPSPEARRAALREVVRSCIYGVDLNPLAVELCKVALWLEAHNPGEPLNFLDHHIKCGNAIVGAARLDNILEGIPDEAFKSHSSHSQSEKSVLATARKANKKARKQRIENRQLTIDDMASTRNAVETITSQLKAWSHMPETNPEAIQKKGQAYHAMSNSEDWSQLRQLATLQTAQFFVPRSNPDALMTDREYFAHMHAQHTGADHPAVIAAEKEGHERRFFHWFLEFPDVFLEGGFDCVLGNPPFLGGQSISGLYGNDFAIYVKYRYAPIGSVDLVGYFFRRIYDILRPGGFLSLISTNTIAQGDTREGSLKVITEQGGVINHAVRSMRWPGTAAVEVALVSIFKGNWNKPFILNKEKVPLINSFLDDQEYLGEPYPLKANSGISFQGTIVLGNGFVLEPTEAQALIASNPVNKTVLFPYLNGQDLNTRPDQSPSRWVINFFDWPERRYSQGEWDALPADEQTRIHERINDGRMVAVAPPDYQKRVAQDFPDCYEIVRERVKPERDQLHSLNTINVKRKYYWWSYGASAKTLYQAISDFERVLVVALTSKTVAFTFTQTHLIFSHATGVFALANSSSFACLQSSFHFHWTWKYASSMKNDLRYTNSDVFQPFPLPPSRSPQLEEIGNRYHTLRSQITTSLNLGLTKIYNQFHNHQLEESVEDLPAKEFKKQFGSETWNLYNHLVRKKKGSVSYAEGIEMIQSLREVHREMDEAVLAAYGWHKNTGRWGPAIDLRHGFYAVEYLPENDNIRYTIHREARREILKRLLLLNHERYAEEVRQGLHGPDAKFPLGYGPEKEAQSTTV